MVETQVREAQRPFVQRARRVRRSLTRAAAASSIVVGVLAVAGAAWAGPMTGC